MDGGTIFSKEKSSNFQFDNACLNRNWAMIDNEQFQLSHEIHLQTLLGFKTPVLSSPNFLSNWVLLPYKPLFMKKMCIHFSNFCLHSNGTYIGANFLEMETALILPDGKQASSKKVYKERAWQLWTLTSSTVVWGLAPWTDFQRHAL